MTPLLYKQGRSCLAVHVLGNDRGDAKVSTDSVRLDVEVLKDSMIREGEIVSKRDYELLLNKLVLRGREYAEIYAWIF